MVYMPLKQWQNNVISVSYTHLAGQKRRAGRILFAANCNKYLSALKGQYNKVKSLTNKDEVNIHIFTGLAGGTGSGAIIDVVAQTRAQDVYKRQVLICVICGEKLIENPYICAPK